MIADCAHALHVNAVDKTAAEQTAIPAPNGGPTLYEAVMLGLPPAMAADRNGFDLRVRSGAQAVCPLRTTLIGDGRLDSIQVFN